MDDGDGYTSTPPAPSPSPTRTLAPMPVPVREDCWSEHATHTLVEAWGDRYLELNRGNLRHKHWQEVADAVNAVHGHTKKSRRSEIQCKNRIDTLKKKYKIEKARVSDSDGSYISEWSFFLRLDALIGSSYKPSPPEPEEHSRTSHAIPTAPEFTHWTVPVGPRSKRPIAAMSPAIVRRNFSSMAAAAAAAEVEEESETSKSRSSGATYGDKNGTYWYRLLAEAIDRVGDIYGRVEEAKQRQMIELEKQRMQFAKDLEIQRMRIFMDAQIQLEKIKRTRTSESGEKCYGSFYCFFYV